MGKAFKDDLEDDLQDIFTMIKNYSLKIFMRDVDEEFKKLKWSFKREFN